MGLQPHAHCPIQGCHHDTYGIHNHPPMSAQGMMSDERNACSPGPMAMREKSAREVLAQKIDELENRLAELRVLNDCLPLSMVPHQDSMIRKLIERIR